MPDSPTAMPQSWIQLVYLGVTAVVASAGTLLAAWLRVRRSPSTIAREEAETRSIDIASDLSMIAELRDMLHEARTITARAERLQEERDHWERKAGTLQQQVDLLNTEVTFQDQQMRRMSGFIKSKGLNASEMDKPKD